MNRRRVEEERGGKETDGCPLTGMTSPLLLPVPHLPSCLTTAPTIGTTLAQMDAI
jgi:hypothetical protein